MKKTLKKTKSKVVKKKLKTKPLGFRCKFLIYDVFLKKLRPMTPSDFENFQELIQEYPDQELVLTTQNEIKCFQEKAESVFATQQDFKRLRAAAESVYLFEKITAYIRNSATSSDPEAYRDHLCATLNKLMGYSSNGNF